MHTVKLRRDPTIMKGRMPGEAEQPSHSYLIYKGADGGKAWLTMSRNSAYQARAYKNLMKAQLFNLLNANPFEGSGCRTLVSFGPGDAVLDRELVRYLRRELADELVYIPVDISEALLRNACEQLAPHARVPLAILGNFETGLPFIQRQVPGRCRKQPLLLSMLGNTFGNIDEGSFLERMLEAGMLRGGDFLLLEVSTASSPSAWLQWMLTPEGHEGFFQTAWGLIANAAASQRGCTTSSLIKEFDHRRDELVWLQEARSSVPGASAFRVIDRATERCIFVARRYHWDSLVAWFEQLRFQGGASFEVLRQGNFTDTRGIGMGAVLLRVHPRKE
jgi:hypothetical protein